jgi:hypothetical protein
MQQSTAIPAREAKHLVILSKISDLDCTVGKLEAFVDRVDPAPPAITAGKAPTQAQPSLAVMLNESPSDLMLLRDRIAKCIDRLDSSLF